jgi:hypothetical protein
MTLIGRARITLCLLFAAVFGLGVATAQAANVYVLTAGDAATNDRVKAVLESGGHTVTLGATTATFDGTQADLTTYDTVVMLNNYSYVSDMPGPGKFALVSYLCGGGGLVTGEWVAYYSTSSGFGVLASALPATVSTYGGATSTTYTQETADPVLNAGVTSPLTFDLDNSGGTESSFTANAAATIYYRSSSGGGVANSPGVVGWTALNGRVLSFSVLLTVSSFQSSDFTQLFINGVTWAARAPAPSARHGSDGHGACNLCLTVNRP